MLMMTKTPTLMQATSTARTCVQYYGKWQYIVYNILVTCNLHSDFIPEIKQLLCHSPSETDART